MEWFIAAGWFVCFVFAWGYAWRGMPEIHDAPPLAAMMFLMVVVFAPLITVGIPVGRFAIRLSAALYRECDR